MLSNRQIYFMVTGEKAPRKAPRRRSHLRSTSPARDWKYRAWIRSLPCAACGTERGVQAAHTSNAGMRIKGPDTSCVPLCWSCHREYDSGLESKGLFEEKHGILMAEIRTELNRVWFEYSGEVK